MGRFADWISIKTPAQRAKEAQRYDRWAFPYGQNQREKIEQLLAQLLPEEDSKIAMMLFLQGKQAYTGEEPIWGDGPRECSDRERIAYAIRGMEENLRGKKRIRIARFLALIIADQQIDETLNYPTKEELLALADTLEQYL